jgi:glycolate oxidase FAD binding subunit
MTLEAPATAAEVAASVAEAANARTPLSINGLGTKARLGAPWNAARRLDLSALNGVTLYEPEELVLSALAGTPIEAIEALLAAHGQELAFEPMSFGPLYGTGAGSIGGCLMANLSGPRRVKAGAARDHILGVKGVNGRGEAFKAGGTVVKNVTGYDLSRGLAGSFGTLAVLTELTFKVLPRAETAATLALPGLAPKQAIEALCAAMGAPVDVSGAAHLPPFSARTLGFSSSATLLRLEGFTPSVNERFDRLAALLKPHADAERLDGDASATLWRAIRDVVPLAAQPEKIIWKISVAPTAGPALAATVAKVHPGEALFDWSGGLVWLALEPDCAPDAGAELIRGAIAVQNGGHATLVRAPDDIRAAARVFQPQPPALRALSQRLKAEFDPFGILEPGRMQAEI